MGKTERKEGKTKKRKKDGRKISHKEDIEREKELGKKKEERETRFTFFPSIAIALWLILSFGNAHVVNIICCIF